MWQSSISAERADEEVLEQIGKSLLPIVDKVGGIVVKDSVSDCVRLSIAVTDRHAEMVKGELDTALASAIGQYYKAKYLNVKVTLSRLPKCFERAYIQALVSFDKAFEQDFIKSLLPETEVLSLDGLMRFRCGELKARWKEVADLAMQTAACSVNREVSLELIKFLVSTIDYVYDEAIVRTNLDGYSLEFEKDNAIVMTKLVSAEELCAELIRYYSKSVDLDDTICSRIEIELARDLFF